MKYRRSGDGKKISPKSKERGTFRDFFSSTGSRKRGETAGTRKGRLKKRTESFAGMAGELLKKNKKK